MLKVVIDTSVFVAGLLTQDEKSGSFQVLKNWLDDAFIVVMSPQILNELIGILARRGLSQDDIDDLVDNFAETALNIPGAYEATFLDDIDPKDNMFLAAAYEAKADYLVSLDKKHILPIKYYHGTQILQPKLFIDVLSR
ncbi:MAG: putative toxin-antitoxin system toxin component, PIN family [Cyanobacteriota bacterium]|nr:putative toxin-antitoxin system toxin component, PIN family [Cyanobacteriota bacterium]